MRNLELPGRSPVHAGEGIAATSHPLATLAAIDILRADGNALDAAVAACAVQCVVEPESTGIGGDCFCLYAPEGSAEIIAYNGSGRAPQAASVDWYVKNGISAIERQSPHAVTVPGAVDAWDRLLQDHGRLQLVDVLKPAIRYAREGYPIASRVSVDFASQVDFLKNDENASRVFMPGGKIPAVGDKHHQPALAATLEKIAREGRDAFYTGEVAEDIVAYLQSKGGLHSLADFAAARGEYVTPISTGYRDYTVHECPPNGQGIIALILLNIAAGFAKTADPLDAQRLHLEIEAGRLAYRDRSLFVADPNLATVPIEGLLSQQHADELRAAIDPARALNELPAFALPGHENTVYITVVDKDRNACSFINSLFDSFGSVLMPPKCGVMLQNRGQGFVVQAGHPNCIAPGKRPLHTIIPGMVSRGDRVVMPFGVMGGHYQPFGHMYFLTRFLDFGQDIQQAQDLPRLFPDPLSGQVQAESGFPAETVAKLRAFGHTVVAPAKPLGGSQAIHINWENGILSAGSDPRKDGCAIGY